MDMELVNLKFRLVAADSAAVKQVLGDLDAWYDKMGWMDEAGAELEDSDDGLARKADVIFQAIRDLLARSLKEKEAA